MILRAASTNAVSDALAAARRDGVRITGFDLAALARVVAHTPEDMTATVEAGCTLAAFQAQLARAGQWLPVDPPFPETTSIGALLAANLSGPRRFGHGTVRDYLLGIKVVLADGRLIKAGGQVVKNVAGYDLCKLFIGSRGSLGVIVEATFKLRPLPARERCVQSVCASLDDAGRLIESVAASELTPEVLDLHAAPADSGRATVVVAFAGTTEEVDWQFELARRLGLGEPASLDYDRAFWSDAAAPRKTSVLPSRLIETLGRLGAEAVVARAGNGVIHYRGGSEPPEEQLPVKLFQRLKNAYDPGHILPEVESGA
jgi:glycolate oxidase FAD binding subunit